MEDPLPPTEDPPAPTTRELVAGPCREAGRGSRRDPAGGPDDAHPGTQQGAGSVRTLGGGDPVRGVGGLQVHVTTVTQRLDRVGRLLGRAWSAHDRALDVHRALRLHRTTAPVGG